MAKMELISAVSLKKLTKREVELTESYIIFNLYLNLKIIFNNNINSEIKDKDDFMVDADFLNFLIQDILLTEEYSITGIANYTDIPEDVIKDLITGLIKVPSSFVWRRLIELHSTLRKEMYRELINKIMQN